MSVIISKRFSVTKTLRDQCGTKTCVASDLLSDGAKVVVKVFRKEQFDYERTRLDRVLAIFTGLRHQHIVPILEAGFTKSGDLYLIREFIEQSEPRPDRRSIQQLLSTVHFLNSAGYVHGSIKPSNVLLTGNDLRLSDPKICDLKSSEDCKDEIQFRAPEVLNGEQATCASDLYSLGALLYRWITGEDAFQDPEMNLLRLKYIWASPKTIALSGDGLETIAHAVLGLLHKDPQKRGPALQVLVRVLQANRLPAVRAPLVGRTETLHQLRAAVLENPKKTMRTIVIQGPPGIGKSRLVEQLGITCGLDLFGVSICCCSAQSSSLDRIIRAINRLIHCHDGLIPKLKERLGSSSSTLSGYFQDDQIRLPQPNYRIERIASDLVGVLAVLARLTTIALVVEDIDRADPVVIKFLEQLCVRAAEAPLALVVTCRTFSPESHLGSLLGEVSDGDGDFYHFRLKPLAQEDTQSLANSMTHANLVEEKVVRLSCGNPLFAEEYAASGEPTLRTQTQESIDWTV